MDYRLKLPENLKLIGQYVTSGMNDKEVAAAMSTKLEIKVTAGQVRKVYEIYASRRTEIIEANKDLKNEIQDRVLETSQQLKRINDFVWKMIEDAESKPELKLACAREILGQLHFQEKLLGKLNDGLKIGSVNKIEITQNIVNSLDQLEKDGVIKVLRKPTELPKLVPNMNLTQDAEFKEVSNESVNEESK